MKKRCGGQAVVEMVALLPVLILCLMTVLLFFQVQGQKIWIHHIMYQGLICLARGHSKHHCQSRLLKQSRGFLRAGQIRGLSLVQQSPHQWKGSLIWKTVWGTLPFEQTLRLDLF